ncbi:hypothetical protein KP509_30G049100 [Ceratopteris richardii]|uniref:Uncharacterized protein n=1 Tax=Ceratopteris richardii TaxID=49495 RepID=A0A8T2R3Z5_CERRI|nr:hypothetical protein KP509_30G049100 [Ceratopteris richardii]
MWYWKMIMMDIHDKTGKGCSILRCRINCMILMVGRTNLLTLIMILFIWDGDRGSPNSNFFLLRTFAYHIIHCLSDAFFPWVVILLTLIFSKLHELLLRFFHRILLRD